jgi:hypothetical protein
LGMGKVKRPPRRGHPHEKEPASQPAMRLSHRAIDRFSSVAWPESGIPSVAGS